MKNTFCSDGDGSYGSLTEAKMACSVDSGCSGVYDKLCDGHEFYLCPGGDIPAADVYKNWGLGSCTYRKGNLSQYSQIEIFQSPNILNDFKQKCLI